MTKNDQLLLTAFAALLTVPVLYLFRGFDDNTLTNWGWVFSGSNILPVFGFACAGVLAALLLARTGFPRRRPALSLFLLGFVSIVPFWREPEVVLDAGRYFLQAKHLELYGIGSFLHEWGAGVSAWTDLPLVPMLYGLIFRFLGETRFVLQIFTTLLFSCTLVLTFGIGKRLRNAGTGLDAALLLLAIPCLLVQVPLMLVDVPALFFVALALDRFLAALDRGGFCRIFLSALALDLAVLAKYSVPLMLLAAPLMLLLTPQYGKQRFVRAGGVAALAGVIIMPVLLLKGNVIVSQIALLRAYQFPGLARWHESPVSTFLFQIHPFVTLLALTGAAVAVRKRDVFFVLPLFFALFSLRVERVRYILPLFPLLTLGAGRALEQLRDREVRRFIAFSAVGVSLAVAVGGYLPFLDRSVMANLRDAGIYLDALPGDSVTVRIRPQRESQGNTELALPILDLYSRKKLLYRAGPRLGMPARADIAPLRFTWECPLPEFYAAQKLRSAAPVAVISSDPLPGSGTCRSFASDTGTFRYKTFVAVSAGPALAETVQ